MEPDTGVPDPAVPVEWQVDRKKPSVLPTEGGPLGAWVEDPQAVARPLQSDWTVPLDIDPER